MYSEMLNPQVVWPVVAAVFFVWLLALSYLFYRYISHYNRLAGGSDVSNLSDALGRHFKGIADAQSDIKLIKGAIEKIEKDGQTYVRKMGVVRFNPFSDTGGDQSFAVSFLDSRGNGVVVSSLHGREGTRMYSKPVKIGKADGFEFSKEERAAIDKALGKSKSS